MRIFCKILLIVLVLAISGCHSHRSTVTHETGRYQRAILDSAATRVDTVRLVDSAAMRWALQAALLEWDSVDYRFAWDSTGRPASVRGTRVVSRQGGTTVAEAVERRLDARHGLSASASVVSDSVRQALEVERHVDVKGGAAVSGLWWRLPLAIVLLAAGMAGSVYLRRWTARRR